MFGISNIDEIFSFLNKQRSPRSILLISFLVILADFVMGTLSQFLFNKYLALFDIYNPFIFDYQLTFLDQRLLFILPSVTIAVVIEELLYRLPISFFYNNKRISQKNKLLLIFVLSFIFAFLHMKAVTLPEIVFFGLFKLPTSLMLGALFIIYGVNRNKIIKPLVYIILVHLFMNIFTGQILGANLSEMFSSFN